MSTVHPSTPSRQRKGKKENNHTQIQQNERLKIIVRRLPPNLPEDIFWQSVITWVTEDTTTWKVFYPGKLRRRLNKENISSRAYIAFKSQEQLAEFSHHYDGHIFRDKNGVESQAVVEFAPYPKIPSDKKKVDTRNGTIEKDEDYISFIESLKAAEIAEPVSLEALIAASQPTPPPKTTPLLEALKAEKSAAKDKEAILRNHAHYKQGDSFRKEEKKKASSFAVPPSKVTPDSRGPASKKSKKSHTQEQSQVADVQPAGITVNPNKAAPRNAPPSFKPAVQNSSTGPASRPPRPPKPSRQSIRTVASTSSAASNVPTDTAASVGGRDGQAELPRRARPVIASRQFEAALSIAGLATSASERRRREKMVDDVFSSSTAADDSSATTSKMEEQDTVLNGRSAGSTSIPVDLDVDKPSSKSPPSPKKERSKREGRFARSGHGGQSSDVPNMNVTAIKIPSILQRSDNALGPAPDIIPRQSSSSNAESSAVESSTRSVIDLPSPSTSSGAAASSYRGRGRRARGFGGRGGRGGRGGQAATAPREGG